jgi:hypothetical protein
VRFNENLLNIGIDPVLVGCPGKASTVAKRSMWTYERVSE